MVLLGLFHQLSKTHGWKLVVAHFNHQLRGRSSDADERLVRRVAQRLKLRVFVGTADVRKTAAAKVFRWKWRRAGCGMSFWLEPLES